MEKSQNILNKDAFNIAINSKMFGANLFESKLSYKEVYKNMNDTDKELFRTIINKKYLTTLGNNAMMLQAYKEIIEDGKISDETQRILLENSMKLISDQAFYYLSIYETNLTYGDLVSIGYLGATNAMNIFLQKNETKVMQNILKNKDVYATFNTFASQHIRYYMQDALRKEGKFAMSDTVQRNLYLLAKAKADFICKNGRIPTNDELAIISNFNTNQIKNYSYYLNYSNESGIDYEELEKDMQKEVTNAVEFNSEVSNSLVKNSIITILKEILTAQEYEIYTAKVMYDQKLVNLANEMNISIWTIRKIFESATAKIEANKSRFNEIIK